MKSTNELKEKWDVQLRKGTLELAILAALKERKLYGLELLKMLHCLDTMTITEGTLYPLMDRLKRDGLIDAKWHQQGESRPRKYYQLTRVGEQSLEHLTSHWRKSVSDIEFLLTHPGPNKITDKGN